MSEPSKKSEEMEQEITRIFGHDRRAEIQANRCVPAPVGCGVPQLSSGCVVCKGYTILACAKNARIRCLEQNEE